MIMASHKKAIVRRHKDSFVLTTDRMAEATIALTRFLHVPYSYTLLYYSALAPEHTQIFWHSELLEERLCGDGAFQAFICEQQGSEGK